MSNDGWSLTFDDLAADRERLVETLTTLGNGRFASRGAMCDATADALHYPGTYLAGGYNRAKSEIAGHEVENEDLVNWPNWLACEIDGPDGPMKDGERLTRTRTLDMRGGTLTIDHRLRDSAGRTTSLREQRLVSMANPLIAALTLDTYIEDWAGTLRIASLVDGRVRNAGVPRYHDLNGHHFDVSACGNIGGMAILECRTLQSGIDAAIALRSMLTVDGVPVTLTAIEEEARVGQSATVGVAAGTRLRLEKIVAFVTERDRAIASPADAAYESVAEAASFDDLATEHRREMAALWDDFDIEVTDHDSNAQAALRFQLFHLLQTLSPHSAELDVGAPARGWHGEAYRGHIFWDEVFVMRVLTLRAPRLARELLRYRFRRLPAARKLARLDGLPGAMFPWQSGSSGREESQTVHLNPRSGRWVRDATHRQRHVGLAIAYNVWSYFRATNDLDFMAEAGTEMLGEIARFFAALATWDDTIGRYRIEGVMGPDEFHTGATNASEPEGLTDNAYTNVLCAWTLARAVDALATLPASRRVRLMTRLAISDAETERWLDVSEQLHVPFTSNGLISQFEGYEDLEELDWDAYRRIYGDIQRMDRILEAEDKSPNAYKVSKQADVLMLPYMFTAETLREIFEQLGYPFRAEDIPQLVEYYDRRTSHGSTLSIIVHAWVVARTDRRRSYDLFVQALGADLNDIQGGSTREGIHLGAMCGAIDMVQAGYLGCTALDDALEVNPVLPEALTAIRTRVRYRGQAIVVDATQAQVTLTNASGEGQTIVVRYRGRPRQLPPRASTTFRLLRPRDGTDGGD